MIWIRHSVQTFLQTFKPANLTTDVHCVVMKLLFSPAVRINWLWKVTTVRRHCRRRLPIAIVFLLLYTAQRVVQFCLHLWLRAPSFITVSLLLQLVASIPKLVQSDIHWGQEFILLTQGQHNQRKPVALQCDGTEACTCSTRYCGTLTFICTVGIEYVYRRHA